MQAMITSTLVTCTIQSSWCCAPCSLLYLNAYERQSMAMSARGCGPQPCSSHTIWILLHSTIMWGQEEYGTVELPLKHAHAVADAAGAGADAVL